MLKLHLDTCTQHVSQRWGQVWKLHLDNCTQHISQRWGQVYKLHLDTCTQHISQRWFQVYKLHLDTCTQHISHRWGQVCKLHTLTTVHICLLFLLLLFVSKITWVGFSPWILIGQTKLRRGAIKPIRPNSILNWIKIDCEDNQHKDCETICAEMFPFSFPCDLEWDSKSLRLVSTWCEFTSDFHHASLKDITWS